MTNTPVSPLRRRMIEDMTIRKYAPRTQEGYIRAVKNFSAFLGCASLTRHRIRRLHSEPSMPRPAQKDRCGAALQD